LHKSEKESGGSLFMKRKEFIHIVGGASVVTAMAPDYVFANGS